MGAHTPADHLTVVAAKVDVLDEKFDVLTERFDVLTDRVDVLTGRVDVLAEQVIVLDKRVTALDDKVDVLDSKVTRLNNTMTAEFADVRQEMRTGFAALEYRIGSSISASEERMQNFVRDALKASEETTHRHMRILHEEVLDRINRLGESRH